MSYLLPTSNNTYPGGITLVQFIQSILVGISGLPGNLVRPKFQINPPKQPQIGENWIAFAIMSQDADYDGSLRVNDTGTSSQFDIFQTLNIQVSFFGPNSMEFASNVKFGFLIPPNREAMNASEIFFLESGQIMYVPDLVNERWIERHEMEIKLRMKVKRTYSVVSLLGVDGTLYSDSPVYEKEFES